MPTTSWEAALVAWAIWSSAHALTTAHCKRVAAPGICPGKVVAAARACFVPKIFPILILRPAATTIAAQWIVDFRSLLANCTSCMAVPPHFVTVDLRLVEATDLVSVAVSLEKEPVAITARTHIHAVFGCLVVVIRRTVLWIVVANVVATMVGQTNLAIRHAVNPVLGIVAIICGPSFRIGAKRKKQQ